MNYNKYIERDNDVIIFHRLDHPLCVTSLIKSIEDGIRKGYDNYALDLSNVLSVYPNAVTPIAGIIEYYKNKGVCFEVEGNYPTSVATTHILSPLNPDKVNKNIMNKVWKFNADNIHKLIDLYLDELRKEERFEKDVLATIGWAICETMDNVIQHSLVEYGYVMGQLHKSHKYITFTIFDYGQGIYASFKDSNYNPRLTTDAITLAMREEVTRDKKVGQGNGLFGLYSIVKKGMGRLAITSGDGYFIYDKKQIRSNNCIPYLSKENQCTTIDFQFKYDKSVSLGDALSFRGKQYQVVDLYTEKMENEKGDIIFKIADAESGTGTRISANRVKNEIFNLIKQSEKRIIVDFTGVIMSSSFADELIAKMFIELGLFQFNNLIKLKGIDDNTQLILQRSIFQRICSEYNDLPKL